MIKIMKHNIVKKFMNESKEKIIRLLCIVLAKVINDLQIDVDSEIELKNGENVTSITFRELFRKASDFAGSDDKF